MRAAPTLALLLLAATVPLASAEPQPDWWFTYAIGPTAPEAGTRIGLWLSDDSEGCIGTPSVDIDILLDGALLERLHAAPIGPCADRSVSTAPHAIPAGLHEFTLVLDPEDNVSESDETDNVQTFRKLFSHDRPDLAVEVTHVDVSGWPAAEFTLHYRLCNVGTAAPDTDVEMHAWRNQYGFANAILPPVAAGACVTGTFQGETDVPLSPRELVRSTHHYSVDAQILPDRLLDETVLDNNRASGTFDVTPATLLR